MPIPSRILSPVTPRTFAGPAAGPPPGPVVAPGPAMPGPVVPPTVGTPPGPTVPFTVPGSPGPASLGAATIVVTRPAGARFAISSPSATPSSTQYSRAPRRSGVAL